MRFVNIYMDFGKIFDYTIGRVRPAQKFWGKNKNLLEMLTCVCYNVSAFIKARLNTGPFPETILARILKKERRVRWNLEQQYHQEM